MQSWEKGDVTSALSKIEVVIAMDRDLPESDSGRSTTYQSFYNQVHSEHDAIKSVVERLHATPLGEGDELDAGCGSGGVTRALGTHLFCAC
jgi:hypothetical protein